MKIVIINGTAQTGKDKFVKIFKDKFQNLRVKNISSVDKVKIIAELAFGWNGKKDEKSRKLLSDMKKVWSEYNDGPTKYIFEKIDIDTKYCLENNKLIKNNVYFLHIREPEEIEKIKNKYGQICTTLLIKKDNVLVPDNYSDKSVYNYKYDYVVDNNGDFKKLEKMVMKFKDFLYKK